MYPITFANRSSLVAPGSRAYAEVFLEDPVSGQKDGPKVCLVDTGADYTILPDSMAATLGLALGGLPVVSIAAADGSTFSLPRANGLDLVIEGYLVTADVLFCSAPKFTPLVGRRDLMNAFNFAFDDAYWYYG
jgi:hypothetical protein